MCILYLVTLTLCMVGLLNQVATSSSQIDSPTAHSNASGQDLTYSCPPWFIPSLQSDGSIHCVCGDSASGHINCNDRDQSDLQVSIQLSKCMTFEEESLETYEFDCILLSFTNDTKNLFTPLPRNVSELNNFTCGSVHREGLRCGSCVNGYGPALYTYELECIECTQNTIAHWFVFLIITFVPVTILFLSVLLAVPINLMSPTFIMLILFAQVTTLHGNIWLVEQVVRQFPGIDPDMLFEMTKVFFSIYGIWNLDFLRPYIRICLSENMTHIQAYFLEYLVALYVFLLIAAMYVIIELHDRNFRVVVFIIKPFRYCFRKFDFTKKLDIRTSTTHALATFVTLVYVKIGTISVHAFKNGSLLNRTGQNVGELYFHFDTTVQCYTGAHLALIIIAVLLLVLIVLPTPMLLIVYQFRWFQRIMSYLPFALREGLRVYMDSFQGYYHNGSNNDKDYRYFSSIPFIIRFLAFTLQFLSFEISLLVMIIVSIVTGIAYVGARPYRIKHFNLIDGLLLTNLGFLYMFLLLLALLDLLGLSVGILQYVLPTLFAIPTVYILVHGCYNLYKKIRQKIHLRQSAHMLITGNDQTGSDQNTNTQGDPTQQCLVISDSLPDRLNHPERYNLSKAI